MTTTEVDELARVLDVTGQLVAAVRDEQLTAPTPCPDWDVRALVSHLVAGNHAFAQKLTGAAPAAAPPDPEPSAGNLLSAYRDGASALLAACAPPGALDQVVTVPFGTVPGHTALHLRLVENLVHGWDLAQATGQSPEFPEDVTERQLAFSRGALGQLPADRSPFAPPAPVPDGAPALDRLAGLLGRAVPGNS
jgi:uncharacterized protein (TIGR03086 family)